MRCYELRFQAETSEIPAARRFVREALEVTAVAESVRAEMVLATSEVIANAVEHGGGLVEVVVEVDRAEIRVSVSNRTSADLGPVSSWALPSAQDVRGRGLAIARALADDVKVISEEDLLTVTLYRRR